MMARQTGAILIHGGRIIDPSQGIDQIGSLLISQGEIKRLLPEGVTPEADYTTIYAVGLIVCPGFIDLHCHLRQPGFEAKETISSGTRAAARGGFTTICCMPNTNPPLDNQTVIEYVTSTAASEGVVRVLPIGCISQGRQGQRLADLECPAAAGVAGFSDDGSPVMNSQLMHRALEVSRQLGLPIIDHCEDINLTQSGCLNEGIISARLGLTGIPAAAEDNMVARDLALAGQTGGRLHIAHVSTQGAVGLIRQAKAGGIKVTAEVTPHHLTLTEEAALSGNTNAKVNPPLRTKEDIQALICGLNDGTIDAIATDHAPHTTADKPADFTAAAFGISGLETALGSVMSLVHQGHLSLTDLITKLTSGPAAVLGDQPGKLGSLAEGGRGDVTIIDPNREWVVDTGHFASKGRNTPLAGATLKGKVMATICQGELVYHHEAIKLENMTTG